MAAHSASETVEQFLELALQNVGGVAIRFEITPVRIGDSLVRRTGGVFVYDVNFAATTELLHLLQMPRRHNENEIGFGDDCGRELSRAMSREIDLPLHANE